MRDSVFRGTFDGQYWRCVMTDSVSRGAFTYDSVSGAMLAYE